MVRRDGSVFPVLVNGSAIYDADGQYLMSRSTVFDISALKQAQAALVESEQRYRLLAENVSDVIVKMSPDGTRTYVSPSVKVLLGYSPEELIGSSEKDLVHPDDRDSTMAVMQESRLTFTVTQRMLHKQGHYVWIEGTYSIIREAGTDRVLEVVGVARDVTERKRAEQALVQALEKEKELGELKTRFVSMASHEFRTPLAGILSSTEMIVNYRHKMREEEIVNRLENIRGQVQHMTGIMEDVLQLGRIQSGRIEFNPVEIDLDKLCQEVIAEFSRTPEAEARIQYHCPVSPVRAQVDARLIRQSFTNLISNALKYSPVEKPISIELLTDSQVVTFRIRDEGIGIPEKDLPHLFEPFRRASNVGAVSGTGLGLSITKQAIEQHGGSVAVDSEMGVGTTFTVLLPAAG
ncbi:MAG: PAS domain S-box protein [Chloroflexi bacterium]|nr:PAS domain S-box protein [Chloroflexota bacterium]